MNCQEFNHLLDSTLPGNLLRTQADAVQRHLGACEACAEEWANWREFAALPVPETPLTLGGRIAASMPARSAAPERRMFRPFLVGSLLAGAAAAAVVAWQSGGGAAPMAVSPAHLETSGAAQDNSDPAAPAPVAGTGSSPLEPAPANLIASQSGSIGRLDPHTIVLIKRPEAAAGVQAIALLERCHDAALTELRALGGLNILTHDAMFSRTTIDEWVKLPERDRDIGRSLGAGRVLVAATEMECSLTLFETSTGEMIPGAGGSIGDPRRAEEFGRTIARSAHRVVTVDEATEMLQARAILLNELASGQERLEALGNLVGRGSTPDEETARRVFDKEVISAALQLMATTPDARVMVLGILRDADDPSLVTPLLNVLANDQDRSARLQAAYILRKYLGEPGVKAALLRAAAEDPDSQPEVVCCIETVREAAERASVPDAEFRNWVRTRLLDESLPARSRLFALAPFTMDGRFVYQVSDIGKDAAAVVFAIGRTEKDPEVRRMAWDVLDRADADKQFVSVLLGDLRTHPDELVRASAAKVLTRHRDDPEVREALERAREDTSMEVRRSATSADPAAP